MSSNVVHMLDITVHQWENDAGKGEELKAQLRCVYETPGQAHEAACMINIIFTKAVQREDLEILGLVLNDPSVLMLTTLQDALLLAAKRKSADILKLLVEKCASRYSEIDPTGIKNALLRAYDHSVEERDGRELWPEVLAEDRASRVPAMKILLDAFGGVDTRDTLEYIFADAEQRAYGDVTALVSRYLGE